MIDPSPAPQRRPSSRDSILDAALQVTAREGAGNLTLDRVALECGLSKGGLLYNFPSKHALLQAMLERLLDWHNQRMEEHYRRLQGEPNATLKAFLLAWRQEDDIHPDVSLAILAAAAQSPGLLEPLRAHFRQVHARIRAESTDYRLSLVLWAAADGLLMHEIMATAPYPRSEKSALLDHMLKMVEETSPQ